MPIKAPIQSTTLEVEDESGNILYKSTQLPDNEYDETFQLAFYDSLTITITENY